MRKPLEFYLGEEGQPNVYHIVTRTAGREILFADGERERFRMILFKQLRTGQVHERVRSIFLHNNALALPQPAN